MGPSRSRALFVVAGGSAQRGTWLDVGGPCARAGALDAVLELPGEAPPSFTARVAAAIEAHGAAGGAPSVVVFVAGGPWAGASLRARLECLRAVVGGLHRIGAGRLVLACDDEGDREQVLGVRAAAASVRELGVARDVTVACAASGDLARAIAAALEAA